ncbi:hypothetical protein [Microbacterium sp. 3J1]|uniref:hypothetical protein n=1 Tax=Microbacterium sp. 3J1 TaxID=861269 RepID=UPI000B007211|nr:hypothetical protein [Microbacterium sp. 3J1]
MNRLQVRRPATLRRRPLRARRLAVVHDEPMEYSTQRPAPRWLVIGTGALGAGVIVELLVGLVVMYA